MTNDTNKRATEVFAWAPGMAFACGHQDDSGMTCYRYPGPGACGENGVEVSSLDGAVMDTSDSATLGCMLAQVRSAWGCPHIHVTPMWNLRGQQSAWGCYAFPADDEPIGKGATEAEALIAAMEAHKARNP